MLTLFLKFLLLILTDFFYWLFITLWCFTLTVVFSGLTRLITGYPCSSREMRILWISVRYIVSALIFCHKNWAVGCPDISSSTRRQMLGVSSAWGAVSDCLLPDSLELLTLSRLSVHWGFCGPRCYQVMLHVSSHERILFVVKQLSNSCLAGLPASQWNQIKQAVVDIRFRP